MRDRIERVVKTKAYYRMELVRVVIEVAFGLVFLGAALFYIENVLADGLAYWSRATWPIANMYLAASMVLNVVLIGWFWFSRHQAIRGTPLRHEAFTRVFGIYRYFCLASLAKISCASFLKWDSPQGIQSSPEIVAMFIAAIYFIYSYWLSCKTEAVLVSHPPIQ